MSMSDEEKKYIFDLIKKHSGMALTDDKEYLLDLKLLPLVRKYSLQSLSDLIKKIRQSNDAHLIDEVIEVMTINESLFFRDIKPFQQLNEIIMPRILASNPEKKVIKIWSAACSSGQEPYSIALNALEKWKDKNVKFEIKATDLSNEILEKAKSGIYKQFEVQRGLPIAILLKYFKQINGDWHVNEEIKSMISFSRLNLISNFNYFGKFDIIFCRNVLIYFDFPTKVKILNNLADMLEKEGFLFLGSAESIIGMDTKLKMIENNIHGIYTVK